ncbi:MAG: RDD family protein [Chloroflexi bacterium]|nr:RDD family protein [Chloroflexota bacterium]
MNCHNCGAEVADGVVSCQSCGTRLQFQCPNCMHPFAPGNRFCGNCGQNLAEVASVPPAAPDTLPSPQPAPQPAATTEAPPTAPETPETPAAPTPSIVICPRCHRPNDPDAAFCFACGFPILTGHVERPDREWPAALELGSPGGFIFRALAFLIDFLVVVFPLVFVWMMLGQPVPENFDQILDPPEGYDRLQVLVLFINMAYHTGLITYLATTVGKRAFGLYVVRTDGSRVGFVRALARHFLTALSANLTLGFIFLFVLFREDRRSVHDLICDTVVVRRQRQGTRPDSDRR